VEEEVLPGDLGLDPEGIAWIRSLLRDFADRGGTVLLSSHLLAEVQATADHLVVISAGQIVARGALADLLASTGLIVTVRAEPMPGHQSSPIPFTRLLRAEWLKTTDARASRWLLAAAALATIAAGAMPLLFPRNVKQSGASYLAWAGIGATPFNLFTIPALEKAGRWVNTGETYGWVLNGEWSGHGAQIATSTVLWIVPPLTIGWARTLRREVR
jgi:hypothetical protein